MNNFWVYVLVMFAVTYLVRVLPFVIFREKIKSRYVRSFLAYIPFTVLGSMTFPAVFYATGSIPGAAAGVVIALVLAYRGKGLFPVAVFASVAAFLVGYLL